MSVLTAENRWIMINIKIIIQKSTILYLLLDAVGIFVFK